MPPPSFEARLAVVETRIESIDRAVGRIENSQSWLARLIVTAIVTGIVSVLVTLAVR